MARTSRSQLEAELRAAREQIAELKQQLGSNAAPRPLPSPGPHPNANPDAVPYSTTVSANEHSLLRDEAFLAVGRDITRARQAEAAFTESETRFLLQFPRRQA
jgi:hypothetical protein